MTSHHLSHRSSRRLKPRRHEHVLSDIVATPERTILPADFVDADHPTQLRVVTTDLALYVYAERHTTRLPWSDVTTFEHVKDPLGDFVIGELRNGDSFRICVCCDGLIVGPPGHAS